MKTARFLAVLLFFCLGEIQAQSVVDTLYCDADVTVSYFVREDLSPGGGRQGYLFVGHWDHRPESGELRAYLRFDLNGIDVSMVDSARLMLWKSRFRKDTLRVHAVEQDDWEEYGLLWNTAPQAGELVASGYVRRKWNSFEVTDYLKSQADNAVSFCLRVDKSTAEGLGFNSREGGAPPMLVVTHRGPSRAEPAPNPGFPSTSSFEHGVYIYDGASYTEYDNIRAAINNVQPGQEIVLGPGVYYESFELSVSGTAEAPLKIRGDGNPRPIIDGSLSSSSWMNSDRGLIKVSGDYWTIEHLEVRNAHPWAEATANAGGLYVYPGDYCTIRDCGVYFNGDGIFCTSQSGELILEYNEVAYNSWPGAGYEHGHYVSGWGTTTVRFCHIHHNGGQNFKSRTEDLVFAYNYVHSCGNYQVDMAEGHDFTDQDAVFIGNLIVTDNPGRTNQQFIVFGENRRGGSLFLFNNTFIHLYPRGSSFVHMWYPGTTPVAGTTFEAWNNLFYIPDGSGSQNLFDDDKPTPVSGAGNWVSSGITSVPQELEQTLRETDPGLGDIQGGDFRPLKTSPLVDAGYAGAPQLPEFQYAHPRKKENRPLVGASIDIGAYEYDPDYTAEPGAQSYDFNGDGRVNIADVVALILAMLRGEDDPAYDVNQDGKLSISDAVALVLVIHQSAEAILASTGQRAQPLTDISSAEREYLAQVIELFGLTAEERRIYETAAGLSGKSGGLPAAFRLEQNFPNPFNPSTSIGYHVPENYPGRVLLAIYDLRGRQVRVLVDKTQRAGSYSAFWDGTDSHGSAVPSGVYLYRLQAGDFLALRKMILLK